MKNKSFLTIALVFLIIYLINGLFLKCTSIGKRVSENKRIRNLLIYVPAIAMFIAFLYYSTEYISDFIYVLIISAVLTGILILWGRYLKNFKYKKIIDGILVWSVMFIYFKLINRNLLRAFDHKWIIYMIIPTIGSIFREDEGREAEKVLIANILGLALLLCIFKVFKEPFNAFGKPEIAGERYLIENKIAKEEDKIRFTRLASYDENIYLFTYVNGKAKYTLSYRLGKLNKVDEYK